MREILFRGKCIHSNEWVYGFLFITRKGQCNIKWYDPEFGSSKTSEVYPESVGQYVDYIDTNGKRVFEYDVCVDQNGRVGKIRFCSYGYAFVFVDYEPKVGVMPSEITVIGNEFDNKELERKWWIGRL